MHLHTYVLYVCTYCSCYIVVFLYQTLVVPFGESYLDWNETYISVFYMVAGAEVRGSSSLCGLMYVGGYALYICMFKHVPNGQN